MLGTVEAGRKRDQRRGGFQINCHILITVLDESRVDAATLVFRTLRAGFPTADVFVDLNGEMLFGCALNIMEVARESGVKHVNPIRGRSHGEWIEGLIATRHEPFWICDGDVIFFDRVEHWLDHWKDGSALFAGRYEPDFMEPWTKTVHVARLHPSLMWINPVPLRTAMRGWPGKPEFFDSVQKELIQWHWVPRNFSLQFYDTMAGLWQAGLGGVPFATDEQNAAFEHLFCGSYAHLTPLSGDLSDVHRAIIANPMAAKGLWFEQQRWYAEHKV